MSPVNKKASKATAIKAYNLKSVTWLVFQPTSFSHSNKIHKMPTVPPTKKQGSPES